MGVYYYDSAFLEYKKVPIKKIIFYVFLIFSASLISIYFFGKIKGWTMRELEVSSLNEKINNQENIIGILNDSINKREYKEYIIWKNYDIVHFDNLISLPDSTFNLIFNEAEKNNVPIPIFLGVIDRESGFKFIPNSEGSGAMGYMQLMPKTFKSLSEKLNLSGGNTPSNNIKAGAYYLKINYLFWFDKFNDEIKAWRYSLAEYAVGRGGMQIINSDSTISYAIPEKVKKGIDRVMKNF